MRAALLALTLGVVAASSALNLVLGGIWLAALLSILLARRRLRHAAALILVLTVAAGVALARVGRLGPPAPRSYATDETAWLLGRLGLGGGAGPTATAGASLRIRLEARRTEELRLTADEVSRRAAAAVSVSRQLGRVRSRAPAEVAGVEEAVGRLALTLTAPEFRDLDGRRRRLREWFAELEGRLAAARDETELETVSRALEPAAMAPVSFRPLREDLARVDRAMTALVRVLAGGSVTVTATARLDYDQGRREVRDERRYTIAADPPLRIVRVDVGALRVAGVGRGVTQTLAWAVAEAAPREVVGGPEIALEPGATRLVVADRRVGAATPVPVRAALRPIAFERLVFDLPEPPGELLVAVAFEQAGGAQPLLVLEAAAARLAGVALPRDAFHWASLAGRLTPGRERDQWSSLEAGPPGGLLLVELVPRTPLLRNPMFARLSPYLYTPNAAATLGLTALAAFAGVLVRRPRVPAPPAAPSPGPVRGA